MLFRSIYFYILCLCISTASIAGEVSNKAAIASAHPLATQAGFEILNQGGNAFDAAVAVSAVLAVVEPYSSGLGGGGFWLIHRASDGFQTMIDGREKAPNAASRDMYLDQQGNVDKKLSLDGALAAAIPGEPAALAYISQKYGKLSLAQTLAPAILYAKQGFKVSSHYRKMASFRKQILSAYPDSQFIFLNKGQTPDINTLISQTDLAHTLEQLAQHGRSGFYQGEVASKLVTGVRQAGGIWTLQDLKNYQVIERKPIIGHYKNYTITSAPLPSSGGIVLMLMLNQLESLPLATADKNQRRHLIVEAMRRAYYDRSYYLGDSDFVHVPTKQLLSKSYGQQLARSIDINRATPYKPTSLPTSSIGEDTTHFSIIDQYGNRVAATLSINYPFGSGFTPKGTGVLLNDEMDDFSVHLGSENIYGLTGNKANKVAANKRPLSSMTPTFIENKKQLMIIGTPGGSRIITMVLLGVLDFIAGLDAQTIVANPRFHHQYRPDYIQFESLGFSEKELKNLQHREHNIKNINRRYGNMQVILKNKQSQQITAASDPRGEGESLVKTILK